MKVTQLGRTFPLLTASSLGGSGGTTTTGGDGTFPGSGQVPTSTGSNTWAWASNVARITSNGSNILTGPFVNFASGTGISFAAASNTLTITSTSVGSNSLLRTTGGAGAVTTIAASGSAKTLMFGGANTFDITLTANCTFTFTGAASAGSESSILLILRQDGTGNRTVTWPGTVTWSGGSPPTLSTTASAVDFIVLETVDGGTVWFGFTVGGSSGTTSPLTTKGDIWAYSTTDARFAVGSNGTTIVANASNTTWGMQWSNQAIGGELLMQDGVSSPPVPIETELGDDWLYADLI